MLFSINLTTEKDAKGSIFLTQKLNSQIGYQGMKNIKSSSGE